MAQKQNPAKTERKKLIREQRKEARIQAKHKAQTKARLKKVGLYIGGILLAGLLGYGGYTGMRNAKVYPPTGIAGHVERFPSEHILTVPIEEAVQKHILEHGNQRADKPGILIQYNCQDCPELVTELTNIAKRYPDEVYLAPYPKMDAKIALTTLDKLEILEDFDQKRIIKFIETYR